jgi:hypothetical protein
MRPDDHTPTTHAGFKLQSLSLIRSRSTIAQSCANEKASAYIYIYIHPMTAKTEGGSSDGHHQPHLAHQDAATVDPSKLTALSPEVVRKCACS